MHALPVLSSLRARFPEAELGWAVEDRFADLLRRRSDLDRLHVIPRGPLRSALRRLQLGAAGRALHEVRRELRAAHYDVVLDLQGNLKSGVVTGYTHAPVRMGYRGRAAKEGNARFSTRRWTAPTDGQHRVERYLGLARALLGEPLPYVAPGFPLSAEEQASAATLLDELGVADAPFVMLHPGTSGFGSFKRWPTDRYAALARRLLAEGRQVVASLGPEERDLGEAIAAAAPGVRLASPSSLGVLAALIARAERFVAADTGPLHLASLLGIPLLGLFGPKDPAIYGPYGVDANGNAGTLQTLVRDDVACRPCPLRRCSDPLCMKLIDPDDVYRAMRMLAT